MATEKQPSSSRKYANRRLYHTGALDLCDAGRPQGTMVKAGEDFLVYDAKSGEDITRSVLTQSSSSRKTRKAARTFFRLRFCAS